MKNFGKIDMGHGWVECTASSGGLFSVGQNGISRVVSTGDGKVELISMGNGTLAHVKSDMGHPAYYPIKPVALTHPVKAVLMDLDGTTVRSEEFWISIIEQTVASLLGSKAFSFAAEDIPFVSGHSVSEHLQYCIQKYAPGVKLEVARAFYTEHTTREMALILAGKGRENAFTPTPGIRAFLLELKAMGIKIALVTSGLYRKAYPEIVSAFETLNMGDPKAFYDCIITSGYPLEKGADGTLGELEAKPHPWLYAEACRVGLGMVEEERAHVLGIEDSGAGVCALRIAGYYTVGIAGGNIQQSGTRGMCSAYCENLDEIMRIIKGDSHG